MLKGLSLGILLLGGISSALAQSSTDWATFWPTTGDGFTEPEMVRVDALGNSFVTGSTPVGDEEFTFVQKYDTNGSLLWTTTYDGPGLSCSCPMDMQLDSAGNAIVTGHVEDLDTSLTTWFTLKVTSAGAVAWAKTDFVGESTGVQIGAGDHVFVNGFADNGTSVDIVTRKISSNGAIVWTKSWNGSGNTPDYGTQLGIDDAGNLYAGGYSVGSTTGPAIVQRVIKYTPNGARLWVKTFALAGRDVTPVKVIGKPGGGCYVASQADGADFFDAYAVVSSHDVDGNPIWRRTIDLHPSRREEVIDMAMSGLGDVTAVTNADSATDTDILVRRFDSVGNVTWTKKYALGGGGDELASRIGVTAGGTVYVVGTERHLDGSWESLVLKYNPAGVRLWDSLYPSAEGFANGVDLAIDGTKAVVLAQNQTTPTRWASMVFRIQ
ncbi:MAG: hypothetical protein ACAH95_03670 [Fimbriimonas sp.]